MCGKIYDEVNPVVACLVNPMSKNDFIALCSKEGNDILGSGLQQKATEYTPDNAKTTGATDPNINVNDIDIQTKFKCISECVEGNVPADCSTTTFPTGQGQQGGGTSGQQFTLGEK